MSCNYFISMAGWEPRFYLSASAIIVKDQPKKVIIIFSKKYEELTKTNRNDLRTMCSEMKIDYQELRFNFDDAVSSWYFMSNTVSNNFPNGSSVRIDITTMPRECIWSLFYALEDNNNVVTYIYSKPEGYADWLTKSPQNPRLMLKHSGVTKLGKPTALIVLTGFDLERTRQLMFTFDPQVTVLGLQNGQQFENEIKNIQSHKELGAEPFTIDAYSSDHGKDQILSVIKKFYDSHNIVVASLGPKPSAIALYKIHKDYPDIALSYAPSNEINPEYSYGLGDSIEGRL